MKRLEATEIDRRLATCEHLVDELIDDLGKEGPSLLRAAVLGMLMTASTTLDMARRHINVHEGRQLALILTIDREGNGRIRSAGGDDPNADLDDDNADRVD